MLVDEWRLIKGVAGISLEARIVVGQSLVSAHFPCGGLDHFSFFGDFLGGNSLDGSP